MIEFNLLPDVKMEYLSSKRLEHLVITVSLIVGSISFAVFIFLFLFVDIGQKVTINDLNNNINHSTSQLESNKNLNQILTIQKQLESLPSVEAQTPTVSRMFNYISELTPLNATISNLEFNFTTNTATITGGADSLATVNQYVDTLKYATYTIGSQSGNLAFNSVVLTSFSYSNTAGSVSPALYTITFNYSSSLFDNADNVTLVVPSETTTRSILNQPDLFKANPAPAAKS